MSSAISKISEQKQNSAKNHADPLGHLILQMFVAKSTFDLAVLIHAYQAMAGTPLILPHGGHPMMKRALDLIRQLDKVPVDVVTPYVQSNVDGAPSSQVTTDWANIVPPSDAARKQAHEARLQSGVYAGMRRIPQRDPRPYQSHPVTAMMLSLQK